MLAKEKVVTVVVFVLQSFIMSKKESCYRQSFQLRVN
jgi:hypothetical protein